MSKISKLKVSRENWKQQSMRRGTRERYLDKELKRIKNKRHHDKEQLQQTRALLEAERKKKAPLLSKSDVIYLTLQLFLVARISFRAVSRVLNVIGGVFGISKAYSHQTVINWLLRFSIVKMQSASQLTATEIPSGSFSNGFIWMIDTSIGIGDGKILAVIALDVHHHQHHPSAPTLKNVHCMGVSVSPSWTGEKIAEFLKKMIATQGRPAAFLKDGGTDLERAVHLLDQQKLGSPRIDDVSHKIANLVKHEYAQHPLFDRFISACGKVSKNLKQTILACLAPPKVGVKARFMNLHRLVTWADRILKHSPPGRAAEGSLLSKLRQSLDDLPQCKIFIRRFTRDVRPLLACQEIIKNQGLSHQTYQQCQVLIEDIPRSSSIGKGFIEWADKQLETAAALGVASSGLAISSDQIESLFGVGKRHGTGDLKDANRMAMRLPALCGELSREEAQKVQQVSVAQQQKVMGSVSTVIGQRQRTLRHPGKLEKLLEFKEQNDFELIPSPKKWSKNLERPDKIRVLENLPGTPFEVPNRGRPPPKVIENSAIARI